MGRSRGARLRTTEQGVTAGELLDAIGRTERVTSRHTQPRRSSRTGECHGRCFPLLVGPRSREPMSRHCLRLVQDEGSRGVADRQGYRDQTHEQRSHRYCGKAATNVSSSTLRQAWSCGAIPEIPAGLSPEARTLVIRPGNHGDRGAVILSESSQDIVRGRPSREPGPDDSARRRAHGGQPVRGWPRTPWTTSRTPKTRKAAAAPYLTTFSGGWRPNHRQAPTGRASASSMPRTLPSQVPTGPWSVASVLVAHRLVTQFAEEERHPDSQQGAAGRRVCLVLLVLGERVAAQRPGREAEERDAGHDRDLDWHP